MTAARKTARTRVVSTRAQKAEAVAMIRDSVKAGNPVPENKVYKKTGVVRAYKVLKANSVLVEKNGRLVWNTDWSIGEIVDLCWTSHGHQQDGVEVTADKPEVKIVQTDALPTVKPEQIRITFGEDMRANLTERIEAALKMVAEYKIENAGSFIANYIIQTNPSV